MKKRFYYPVLAIPIYLLALLPFPLLYLLSDLLYLIGYYLIGYRKKVIHQNLRNSFPEKSEAEITRIGKQYFAFMIDVFLETFKLLVISPKEISRRATYKNFEVIQSYADRNQSFMIVMGHMGNWEWSGPSFQLKNVIQGDVLYHPLSSGFFDWIIHKLRTRFGIRVIPMQVSIKEMIRRKDELTATVFISDQTPSNTEGSHWMTFLNQDTPVFLGAEKIAKKMNRPVIYAHTARIKRGHYQFSFTPITDHPKDTPDNWITEQHTKLLEQDIINNPSIWLWSHRRWKHKRNG